MTVQDAGPGQGELLPTPGQGGVGPLETALVHSVKAASLTAERWSGAVAAARAGARAMDRAEARGAPQIVAQLLPRYLDTLERLGLLPGAQEHGAMPLGGQDEGSGSELAGGFGGLSVVGGGGS